MPGACFGARVRAGTVPVPGESRHSDQRWILMGFTFFTVFSLYDDIVPRGQFFYRLPMSNLLLLEKISQPDGWQQIRDSSFQVVVYENVAHSLSWAEVLKK